MTCRWQTPLAEGDKVNLIAKLDHHEGGLHAICNFSKGNESTAVLALFICLAELFARACQAACTEDISKRLGKCSPDAL